MILVLWGGGLQIVQIVTMRIPPAHCRENEQIVNVTSDLVRVHSFAVDSLRQVVVWMHIQYFQNKKPKLRPTDLHVES